MLPELEPFKVNTYIQEPTIRVRIGIPRPQKPGEDKAGHYLRYREMFGHLGFEVISKWATGGCGRFSLPAAIAPCVIYQRRRTHFDARPS